MTGCASFRCGLGFSLLLCALSSAAQDSLPTVIIEADAPVASATEPEFFTGPVRVVPRDDFPESAETAADILASMATVQVQVRGERGSGTMVQVRGAPGRHTHVYIDGIRVGSPGTDTVDLSRYGLGSVEAIEVYSASSPPQFAESGIGGSVNIVTRDTDSEDGFLFRQSVGSFGSARQSIRSQQNNGPWGSEISGFWETAVNDFEYVFDNGTPNNAYDDSAERRENAEFRASGASFGLTRRLEGSVVSARGSVSRQRKNLPTWNNRDIDNTYYASDSADFTLSYRQPDFMGSVVASESRLFSQYHSGTFFDPEGNIALSGTETEDMSRTIGAHQTFSGSWASHFLHSVLEVREERFTVGEGAQKDAYERWLSTVALSDEWYITPSDSTLQYGARLHRVSDTEPRERIASFSAWQAGLAQPLGPVTLQFSYQNTFRVPALYEIYGDQGSFRGNSDLTSETSNSYDAYLSWSPGPLSLELGYFYRESRNAIAPVYNSQGVGRYENIGLARFRGLETDLDSTFEAFETRWHVGASGSWQQSIIETPFAAYNDNQVPGYYPRAYRLVGQASRDGRRIRVTWNHNAGLFYDRANSTQAPVKQRVNVDFRQQFSSANAVNHSLALSISDLFDNGGQDYNRSPLPGRSYSLIYQFNQ